MKKGLVTLLMLCATLTASAQQDDEYLMEIGGGVGMVSYQGDFNGKITSGMQPAGAIVWRRLLNPYMGFRVTGMMGKLKGDATRVETYYPDETTRAYSFDRSLTDVSVTYEYNFWPYGTGRDYRGAKRLTPFVFGGIGATYVSGGEKKVFTANVPIGLGIKYKLKERLNVGLEWSMHFSLSDELDGMADPYGIKSSGAFKNTDCYSGLMLTLTYSFKSKCRTCNNDD
uniref:type IX secretion system protein PorG n=1 Tax=Prevotella sp. TaxID=59823 RepID=UPI0040288D28